MQKTQADIFNQTEEKKKNQRKGEQREAVQKLDTLANESSRVILDIKAVFPFNFFPDELIIDETKVSVHTRYFYKTKQVTSIEYKDIFNVVVQHSLFFATIEIVDRFFSQRAIAVNYLKKDEAMLARRIIQGMVIAKKQNVSTESLPIEALTQKLDRIGQSR